MCFHFSGNPETHQTPKQVKCGIHAECTKVGKFMSSMWGDVGKLSYFGVQNISQVYF